MTDRRMFTTPGETTNFVQNFLVNTTPSAAPYPRLCQIKSKLTRIFLSKYTYVTHKFANRELDSNFFRVEFPQEVLLCTTL